MAEKRLFRGKKSAQEGGMDWGAELNRTEDVMNWEQERVLGPLPSSAHPLDNQKAEFR